MAKKKKALTNDEKKKGWLKELQENEELQKYLSKYKEGSANHFMDYYVGQKFFWLEYGLNYAKRMEDDSIKWVDIAYS